MINPGDAIYIDGKGQVYSKPWKGRKYLGRYPKTSKNPIEEGQVMAGVIPANFITKESTKEAKGLKKSGFSISTNVVKVPEMKKEEKPLSFSVENP